MKMAQQKARLYGLESSAGEFQGNKYDSTKFHLSVDLGEKSTGTTMGIVTRPFKFGTSEEAKKWEAFREQLNRGAGLPVLVELDVTAASDGVKLTLLSCIPDVEALKQKAA